MNIQAHRLSFLKINGNASELARKREMGSQLERREAEIRVFLHRHRLWTVTATSASVLAPRRERAPPLTARHRLSSIASALLLHRIKRRKAIICFHCGARQHVWINQRNLIGITAFPPRMVIPITIYRSSAGRWHGLFNQFRCS